MEKFFHLQMKLLISSIPIEYKILNKRRKRHLFAEYANTLSYLLLRSNKFQIFTS